MNKLLLVDFYQQIAITHEQTLNNLINRKVFILLRLILRTHPIDSNPNEFFPRKQKNVNLFFVLNNCIRLPPDIDNCNLRHFVLVKIENQPKTKCSCNQWKRQKKVFNWTTKKKKVLDTSNPVHSPTNGPIMFSFRCYFLLLLLSPYVDAFIIAFVCFKCLWTWPDTMIQCTHANNA